jgi:MSHA biogenesis protein MshE
MRAVLQAEIGERANTLQFHHGRGCAHCNHTGYQGRVGVYELLEMDEDLVKALHAGPIEFAQAAKRQAGYQSLRASAIAFAAQGITTMEQVVRATFGTEE